MTIQARSRALEAPSKPTQGWTTTYVGITGRKLRSLPFASNALILPKMRNRGRVGIEIVDDAQLAQPRPFPQFLNREGPRVVRKRDLVPRGRGGDGQQRSRRRDPAIRVMGIGLQGIADAGVLLRKQRSHLGQSAVGRDQAETRRLLRCRLRGSRPLCSCSSPCGHIRRTRANLTAWPRPRRRVPSPQ